MDCDPDEQAELPAGTAAAENRTSLGIEVEADATLGYASIQNSVPVIRSLRLSNHGAAPLENLKVLITCSPRFAQGINLRFDSLAPGERRLISPIDLHPDHGYLAELQESVKATVEVTVLTGTNELAHSAQPLEVLAYDQWAGTRALPELLAAFCMPNNPAVDSLIGKASKLLRSQHSELSMNGYQSKNRETVWKQVSALYNTLSAEALQYSEPPASFGADGQKIRTPERILDSRVATCLDLAMLFASCLEQAGLRPVVLIKEGHAWVGVWLRCTCFQDPLTDDIQSIRKRIDSGEFLVFETTGVAQHHSHRPSLRIAMEQGHAHLLEDGSFRYAVDIHRAREVQIKPLPSRTALLRPTQAEPAETPDAIEPTPLLPPLDPELLTPLDLPATDSPEGRLSKWKSKLLDLTLRNRLLNFKQTKTTLQFVAPDLAKLEDALADGADFKIRPRPVIMEGADPRMAQVHTIRAGRTPLDDMALEALAEKDLIAWVKQDDLDANLLNIFSAARTGLEEGGANTLYLAIGLLKWVQAEKADTTHLAPILLVPVSLQRQSVRSGFRLSRHDDEAIVNPTLLELLKNNFELRVAGLDLVPTDKLGIDVGTVLQSFRLAVREIPKWEVLEQVHLGIFSFTKFLMWKDLQDRTEALKANRVVRHLIENPGQAFPREGQDGEFDRLDETHPPQEILAPLLSDSSQLKALCAIDAGRDLVLEGPPGTGKSQTITNLIAHSLAKGKTVLFVSEKMAALEVVHRRLTKIGLDPFCLELHSSKAKKSEVLQQLGKALDIAGQRSADDWLREADRLAQLRQELNGLVDSLHRQHPSGLTVYEAIGICIQNADKEPSPMPWADPLVHSRDDLDRIRDTARKMSALAGSVGQIASHALSQIGRSDWSPSWQDDLLSAALALDVSIRSLKAKAASLGSLCGLLNAGLSLEGYSRLDTLADILLAAPKVPSGLARQAHDPAARARIHALAKHGAARNGHWSRVGPGWTAQLAKLNGTELQAQWGQATSTWWPKSALAKRGIRARLAAYRTDAKRPTEAAVSAMLVPLVDLNEEDQVLRSMETDAQALLEETYAGPNTDWESVGRHEDWANKFSNVVTLIAGSEVGVAGALRQRLQPLVTEDRAALAPGAHGGRALLDLRDAWRDLRQNLEAVETLAKPLSPLQGPADANGALERIQAMLVGWHGAKRLLQPWCLWRNVRDHAVAQGLQGIVASLEGGTVPLRAVEEHFEFSYSHWWVKKTIDNDPILRGFSSADHERKIREFRQADTKFQKLTEKYIAATLSGRVPSGIGAAVSPDTELGRLRRELQKKRKQMPVRQLVQALPTLLPRLKPCLLMSPLSVAQYLDVGYAQFDLVVFDEASQIPVWDAVGSIARGKQLAVVGDPKQLPPTNFFNKSSDSDDGPTGDEQIEDLESILDECLGAGMNRLSLLWHYRSRHESLITFSNVAYYNSQLITFPSPVTDDVAVRFERVHGVYDRGGTRTNRAEAQAIVNGIEAHYLANTQKNLSLGVVTFNQPQQSLIETLLDARRRENQSLDRAIADSSHEPLFIKNLENVQGDQRDVIFFSITYGPDAAGKITMNFGPLNGEGGHRRLNVAISRACEAVVIYSSLLPQQIDLAKVRAAGVRDLKHYLEFALKGPRALVEKSIPTGLEPDSPFETAVIKVLRDRNWEVHPQVGCSGYRIDLGVVDPRAPGRYLIGIECDGRSYHSGATARDRDRLRQHVLEGLGWRIHRIWSTDWWLNPDAEIDKILERLHEILESGADVETEPFVLDEASAQPKAPDTAQPDLFNGALIPNNNSNAGAVQHQLSSTHAYTQLPLTGGDPVTFYAPSTESVLSLQLQQVIDMEGPISEQVLFRRIARAWGLERTGSRIVERLKKLLPTSVGRTIEDDTTFYWPVSFDSTAWAGFRVSNHDELSRRHINDVGIEEINNLVLYVLQASGSAPRAEVGKSVCRLIGMARVTTEAEARVSQSIDQLCAKGRLSEADTIIRIT